MIPEKWIKTRLKNEYECLMRLPPNDIMAVEAAPGEDIPYVRRYIVTYNIPVYTGSDGSMSRTTTITVELDECFPSYAPAAQITGGPIPFHPHIREDGSINNGNIWNSSRWLYEYFVFIGEMLQYRPDRMDTKHPDNREAAVFCMNNPQLFPTDTRPIPAPVMRTYMLL